MKLTGNSTRHSDTRDIHAERAEAWADLCCSREMLRYDSDHHCFRCLICESLHAIEGTP